MRLWILTTGEPTPLDQAGSARLMRSGVLTGMAASMGHEVTWWASTLAHSSKRLRFDRSTKVRTPQGYDLWHMHGGEYKKNVSIDRLINHARVGVEFFRLAKLEPAPDVIFCSVPIIELATAALAVKRRTDSKLVLDVRDFWPDIWWEQASGVGRMFIRTLATPWNFALRRAVLGADAVYGFTDAAVDWAMNKAGRTRSSRDRAFPFAYPRAALAPADLNGAEAFWDSHDVRLETVNICFIGTFTRRFDEDFKAVISCAALLNQHLRKKIRIVLAGTGEAIEDLRQTARDLPHVVLPGWVDSPKIHALMGRSKAGLLPYANFPDFMRSIPNKLPEYFSSGLPVITSLNGISGALIDKERCGVRYPQRDSLALARILENLCQDPDTYSAMGLQSLDLYRREFMPENVYTSLINSLQELKR